MIVSNVWFKYFQALSEMKKKTILLLLFIVLVLITFEQLYLIV